MKQTNRQTRGNLDLYLNQIQARGDTYFLTVSKRNRKWSIV